MIRFLDRDVTPGPEKAEDLELPFFFPMLPGPAGQTSKPSPSPVETLSRDAEIINGIAVGLADLGVAWLEALVRDRPTVRTCLIVVLYPAGPTRESHLKDLLDVSKAAELQETRFEVRLKTIRQRYSERAELPSLPPTILQGFRENPLRTTWCIGTAGDLAFAEADAGTVNVVFRPEDDLRDAWRLWFEREWRASAPLTELTAAIPFLVPAAGQREAGEMWGAFEALLGSAAAMPAEPSVAGGSETPPEGERPPPPPWDGGRTATDELATEFQRIYPKGSLVSVDAISRIRPLSIPVKAVLLGQKSERQVGDLKQKQSFNLTVLDGSVEKEIEKCRKVTEVLDLLSLQLAHGNRWITDDARPLLVNALEEMNRRGLACLREALQGDVTTYVDVRCQGISEDLNGMYRQLGMTGSLPRKLLDEVLEEVRDRLRKALEGRITPLVAFNRIQAPDLRRVAPDANWSQPLSLIVRSAKLLRESLTDPYFPRRFSAGSPSLEEFHAACNPFSDVILRSRDPFRARQELEKLREIEGENQSLRDRCEQVWELVHAG